MGAADRAEFADIPAEVKERQERLIRLQAFEVLHAEAVARGDLGEPPATHFDKLPGRVLTVLFALSFGAMIGSVSVVLMLYVIRTLAAVFQ